MGIIMKRKKCKDCGEYLISFQGHYLHPDTPCSGIPDYIDIEATIADDFLHKKFIELYGSPEMSDYDLLNEAYKNPILRFILEHIKKRAKKPSKQP